MYLTGNGEVDVALMSVLPELKVYSAAEPDESLRETLKQRVENMGRNIQVHGYLSLFYYIGSHL